MDEDQFRRLLDHFPVVRSRHYHADADESRQSTSQSTQDVVECQDDGDKKDNENQGIDQHDAFWEKLKLAAERKVGLAEAERFCRAFQRIHKKLVYEELSLDAARRFINSSKSSGE